MELGRKRLCASPEVEASDVCWGKRLMATTFLPSEWGKLGLCGTDRLGAELSSNPPATVMGLACFLNSFPFLAFSFHPPLPIAQGWLPSVIFRCLGPVLSAMGFSRLISSPRTWRVWSWMSFYGTNGLSLELRLEMWILLPSFHLTEYSCDLYTSYQFSVDLSCLTCK